MEPGQNVSSSRPTNPSPSSGRGKISATQKTKVEPREESFGKFLVQVYLRQPQMQAGHLRFLMHLLAYALCYALWREVIRRHTKRAVSKPGSKSWVNSPVLGCVVWCVTFIARIHYPIDTWKNIVRIPIEIAHLPQYLSLFAIGAISYRQDWFRRLPRQQGFIWLGIGLGAVLLRYGYTLGGETLFPTRIIAGGGWDWRSLVWSIWESTICVSLCTGILTLFREFLNRQGLRQMFAGRLSL